ncbi:MAG: ATP-dependent DNA helicase [Candidatus Micrarchaeota archaeon]|nr:ATP-dependent DNA helicase [Candidatus Micrarchaeota archaeon]
MDLLFRHNELRRYQKNLAEDSYSAFMEQKILFAEAPTGLGKTDALLGAALTVAEKEDLTVFFLTPKISQHRLGLEVIRGINKKCQRDFSAVDVIGKKHMCIHPALKNADAESFYSICDSLKKKEMCPYCRKAVGYNRMESETAGILFSRIKEKIRNSTHNEMVNECMENEACPYEIMMRMAKDANVIIADYYHIFSPGVREGFLMKTKKDMGKSILIVDEAHNLPKRLREDISATINTGILKKVDAEMGSMGYEAINLSDVLQDWAGKKMGKNNEEKGDVLEFIEKIRENYELGLLNETLLEIGDEYSFKTESKSACLKLASFFDVINYSGEEGFVDIITKKESGYALSRRSLDPSSLSKCINNFHSAAVISATLNPIDMYVDLLGIDKKRALSKVYPSPFPKENRMTLITEGVTTKYSKRVFEEFVKYAQLIERIYSSSPGSVVVFFPSYKVMKSIIPLISIKQMLVQKENSKPHEINEMMHEFKKRKSIMMAVQGGSISEGVDFNNNEIKVAVVAGIALEEMGVEVNAVIEYYDRKFGKGWEYGYIFPAITKAVQSAGRAIRKETDRARVVFMDERYNWSTYRRIMPEDKYIFTRDLEKYMEVFFK